MSLTIGNYSIATGSRPSWYDNTIQQANTSNNSYVLLRYDDSNKIDTIEHCLANSRTYKIRMDHFTLLDASTVSKTDLSQKTEERLLNFVRELDVDFIEDMWDSMENYLHDKAYDIAEQVLSEDLSEKYRLKKGVTEDMIVEAIVDDVDFNECYEIIHDIQNAPSTLEERLRDVGMSIKDFI